MEITELAATIMSRRTERGRPIVVGISGYGGAGKSTLARELLGLIPDSVRMRGDDFLDPSRSHRRSTDWDGVERSRLVREVLGPFRDRLPSRFRRFDWSARALGEPEPIPTGEVLIVDLIGLFHPEVLGALDLTVWCDVDLATAQRRGMRRDSELGRDHSNLWNEVWVPNERDFDELFAPASLAEIRIPML
ncbi:uridine kinase family protein [Microbacterium natoriense]|nr:phosphoglycerate transporter [Microbacterium natoriense]